MVGQQEGLRASSGQEVGWGGPQGAGGVASQNDFLTVCPLFVSQHPHKCLLFQQMIALAFLPQDQVCHNQDRPF